MAFDSYSALRSAILRWLGRPGDTLIADDVPDMIRLFEAEASRRLKTRWNETTADLAPDEGDYLVALPSDFSALRSIRLSSNNPILNIRYLTPEQLTRAGGSFFTIEGNTLRLADPGGAGQIITIGYMTGLPPLGDAVQSNWLLASHPDAYLFGSLVEAEAFVGNDERAGGWFSRREAAFQSIIKADADARWGGGGLQMRPDWLCLGSPGGSGGSAGGQSVTATTTITLTPNATLTTLVNQAIRPGSFIALTPETDSAAQASVVGIWVAPGTGSAAITHTSYEATDQRFGVLIR